MQDPASAVLAQEIKYLREVLVAWVKIDLFKRFGSSKADKEIERIYIREIAPNIAIPFDMSRLNEVFDARLIEVLKTMDRVYGASDDLQAARRKIAEAADKVIEAAEKNVPVDVLAPYERPSYIREQRKKKIAQAQAGREVLDLATRPVSPRPTQEEMTR